MYTALYYPHTITNDASIIKTALLLWDKLEFIVPNPNFKVRSTENDPEVDQALELIGTGYYPSWDQQSEAHQLIEDLATSNLPKDFFLDGVSLEDQYLVYPGKFLHETWQILKDVNLAVPKSMGAFEDWSMSRNLGLTIMSILADTCADDKKRKVTDRISAYKALNHSIAQLHGGHIGQIPDSVERLVTISLQVIDVDQFTLKELIEFRQKEAGPEGRNLRKLRHKYLENIDDYVERISNSNGNETDVREIERQFKTKMEDDLSFLKDGLKRKATDVLLSKEVGVGILAAAGMAITPWTVPAGIIGIGALLKKAKNYREERKDVLAKHAMSWLFTLKGRSPIQLY